MATDVQQVERLRQTAADHKSAIRRHRRELSETMEKLKALGVEVTHGPSENPGT